jgi:hypothetical protein
MAAVRWGPLVALLGVASAGLYGWLGLGGSQPESPRRPDPAVQTVGGTPVPPPPPASVRPEAAPPALVPRLDADSVVVRPDGAVSISGVVDPGARVSLIANGVAVAEATADAEGRFSLGPSAALAPGTTEFRVRSVLGDGRTATSAETLTVVAPRTAAEAFVATLAAPGAPPRELARVDPRPLVVPSLAEARVAPDGAVSVSGVVDPGARVSLVANGVAVAEATADAEGRFSLGPAAAPAPGTTEVRLRSTLGDGREATSAETVTIVVPRTTAEAFVATLAAPGAPPRELLRVDPRPLVAPSLAEARVAPDGSVSLSGRADPGARVDLLANGLEAGTTTADAVGAFSLGVSQRLGPGRTELSLRVTHPDGRQIASPDHVVVDLPALPGGAFTATLQGPGGPPRVIASREAAPARVPRFETVRVEPNGVAGVAGVVDPQATVSLRLNDRVLGSTTAGPSGAFGIGPTAPLPPGESVLRLRSELADGRAAESDERLVVQIPRTPAEPFQVVVEALNAAPRVLSRVDPAPVAPPTPEFDGVQVEADGRSAFSGRTVPGGRIALVRGAAALGETVAGPGGEWSIAPSEPFPPGTSELRLRATGSDGRASSLSDQRLTVLFPDVAGQPYGAVLEAPGQPPRVLVRGSAATPAPSPVDLGLPLPEMPAPPVIESRAQSPAPPAPALAPSPTAPPPPATAPPAARDRAQIRADVPPPPRRALPDRLIK